MKTKSPLMHLIIIIIVVCPLIYLALIWRTIPDIIPVHYSMHFEPDRMDNKRQLWIPTGIIAGVSLILYFLLLNIRKIDPKQKSAPESSIFKRLAIGIVIFLTALNFIIILSANQRINLMEKSLFPLLGLLFAFIGNYMSNIKPNYFAGIRLPWTLSSDYNWRKTHQFAGKLWFWGGLLSAIISVLIPLQYAINISFFILFIMILLPTLYSYRLFKKEQSV